MKFKLIVILLFLAYFSHAQYKIQGKVIDAETQKPLDGINIFLSHTTNGIISNDKGEFQLDNLKQGKYELVATSLNYEDYIISIQTSQIVETLVIKLTPISNILKEVVVESYDSNGWEKWGESFKSYFIGSTQLANNCKLLNPEVIKFKYRSNTNKLRAFTNEKLVFENKNLGYRIKYLLSKFEIDFNNKTFSFKGYPLFEELESKKVKEIARWTQMRNKTYKGSIRHFMKSLYFNQLSKDGFEIRKVRMINDDEANRVKELLKQLHEKEDKGAVSQIKFNKDSLEYFMKVRNLNFDENKVTLSKIVLRDSIVSNLISSIDPDSKSLYFENYLQVLYLNKKNPSEYAKSLPRYRSNENVRTEISLRFNKPIFIYQNGNYFNGLDLLTDGYWAWFEKVSTMLPSDYTLSK